MKMKEMFKKVETYNELAEMMNTSKAYIWFADKLGCGVTLESGKFTNYGDFRKFVRKVYVKKLADYILNFDGWNMNSDMQIGENTYEVYIEQ